jgi:hypothetical protein
LATTQTITGAKTFSAAATFGTLNATALQVGGVNVSSTYATQTALGLKQDKLTAITTSVPVLNGATVTALTGSRGNFVSALNDTITIQGPDLSGYALNNNPSFTGSVTMSALFVTSALTANSTDVQTTQHLECFQGFKGQMFT